MFLMAYYGDREVMGLPGCVMYSKRTTFDLILPRVLASKYLHAVGKDYDKLYYDHLVSILNISDHLDKKVCQLSGGQQKRVSIARTFMTEPEIILMDEPFSCIDNILRDCLRRRIKDLVREKNIMGIFVTHDLEEGYEMADKALIVRDGHIVERRRGKDLFEKPDNEYTKIFIKNLNFHSMADDLKTG